MQNKTPDYPMTILGLDPGSTCFGYAVLRVTSKTQVELLTFGTVKPGTSQTPLPDRLQTLYTTLDQVFLDFQPNLVSIEQIFYHKNVKSAVILAHARSVGLLLSAKHQAQLLEFSPRKIKLSTSGSGGATKEQVRSMVCCFLSIDPDKIDLDSSDAASIALCAHHAITNPVLSGIPAGKKTVSKQTPGRWMSLNHADTRSRIDLELMDTG